MFLFLITSISTVVLLVAQFMTIYTAVVFTSETERRFTSNIHWNHKDQLSHTLILQAIESQINSITFIWQHLCFLYFKQCGNIQNQTIFSPHFCGCMLGHTSSSAKGISYDYMYHQGFSICLWSKLIEKSNRLFKWLYSA